MSNINIDTTQDTPINSNVLVNTNTNCCDILQSVCSSTAVMKAPEVKKTRCCGVFKLNTKYRKFSGQQEEAEIVEIMNEIGKVTEGIEEMILFIDPHW